MELAQLAQVDLALRLEAGWYSSRAWMHDGRPEDLLGGLYWLGAARCEPAHTAFHQLRLPALTFGGSRCCSRGGCSWHRTAWPSSDALRVPRQNGARPHVRTHSDLLRS